MGRRVFGRLARSDLPLALLDPVGRRCAGARQAGWLFVATGALSICYDVLPNELGDRRSASLISDVLTLLLGLVLLRMPWRRVAAPWFNALPIVALLHLGVSRLMGVVPDELFGSWVILVFVWVGLWLPPRHALRLAPAAVLAFLLPLAVHEATLGSVAATVPVAIIVGEALARRTSAMQRAHEDRQRALDALAEASVTDVLTGLGNRRRADQLLDDLGRGDALAVFDLDHFKRVNDEFGHQRGDVLLAELGRFFSAHVREEDAVARFGGEEFVMVLRRVPTPAAAAEVVERLLVDWRNRHPAATLSAGVALHDDRPVETFARADAALYRAKETGRDRLVVAA